MDISSCGELDMENNTLRVHPTVFDINANAVRKCQSMVLTPLVHLNGGKNVYGIHVTDVQSGYGFQSADAVRITPSLFSPMH